MCEFVAGTHTYIGDFGQGMRGKTPYYTVGTLQAEQRVRKSRTREKG